MSDGIFDRVMNLIKGASENFLKEIERDNPAAVYQSAIDAQEAQHHKVQSALTALKVQRQGLDRQAEKLDADIAALSAQAAQLAGHDDTQALAALEKKARAEALKAALPAEKQSLDLRIEESQQSLQSIKSRWQSLKQERDLMLSRLAEANAAKASAPVDPLAGPTGDAAEDALARARENMERKGIMASFDSAGATLRSAADAARLKAQAELEALKKAVPAISPPSLAQSTPASSVSPASKASTPEATADDAPPRRSLDVPDSPDATTPPDTIPRRTL